MENSVNTRPLLEQSDTETEDEEIPGLKTDNIPFHQEEPLFKPLDPKDKYYLAYFIFYLLGMTTLIPWNFFITANDYWMYKFRDTSSSVMVTSDNSTSKRSPLQAEFTPYLSIASNAPNVAFLIINAGLSNRISLPTRVIGSFLLMLILFIITTVFVNVNTDSWQQQFFTATIFCVVLLNVSSAILSGSIFGIVGKFSPQYISGVIGGQALGGIFAAVAQILCLAIGVSSTHAAFVYFMVGNIMIVTSLGAYVILSKTVFFKFHTSDKMGVGTHHFPNELLRPRIICYRTIYKKVWPYTLSAFLVFAVTLSAYPGVTVLIESEGKGNGSKWNDVFFVPVVAYLLFSSADYTGRVLAGLTQWPRKGWILITLNLLRLVFIPLLLLCNAQPRQVLPVLIDKDWYYMVITVFFAITNGYLANMACMCAPRVVEHHEKEVASSMVAVFIGVGLALGAAISLFIVKWL